MRRVKLISGIVGVVLCIIMILVLKSDTYAGQTVYDGRDYSYVYDKEYYLANNPDVEVVFGEDDNLVLFHFVRFGMAEGRTASPEFEVFRYKENYEDLQNAFGEDLQQYYYHYMRFGYDENRIACAETMSKVIDYTSVYDTQYYYEHNADLQKAFGYDTKALLIHFINFGQAEGRQANNSFHVFDYQYNYADLFDTYGDSLRSYYNHYINYGRYEGRVASYKINYMSDLISGLQVISPVQTSVGTDSDGIFTITDSDGNGLKVLQLTDIHISGITSNYAKDVKAINATYKLVEAEKPDLIVVTGDFIFGMPYTNQLQDRKALDAALLLMDQMGIPWIWTFGNHDHNFFDHYSASQISDMLSASSTLLMYPKMDNVFGYSNGAFKLCNADGSINKVIYTLDSNASLYANPGDPEPNDYDYIRDNQVNWYADQVARIQQQVGKQIESFIYIHIPLRQYITAWNLYQQGSNSVKYYYGMQREAVCAASVDSSLFSKVVQLNSTKAIFSGHDHVNDYAIEYNGINLVYGKSIDYTAYIGIENQTEQRGATLLDISNNLNYTITPIKLTQIQ